MEFENNDNQKLQLGTLEYEILFNKISIFDKSVDNATNLRC